MIMIMGVCMCMLRLCAKTKIDEKQTSKEQKFWCKNALQISFYFIFTNALEQFVYISVYVLNKKRYKFLQDDTSDSHWPCCKKILIQV